MTNPDPERWGVSLSYTDVFGQRRDAPPQTVEAVLRAMTAGTEAPPDAGAVLFVRPGQTPDLLEPALLVTEDGGEEMVESVPGDLPLGYHRLERDDATTTDLICAPAACYLPEGLRTWGLAVQLYAIRSRQSAGMGDLADLRDLASWSRERGAGMLMVNPLHAAIPGVPQQPSPYFPSSRRFRNPLYLRVDGAVVDQTSRRIDRDQVYAAKMALLEERWSGAGPVTGAEDYATFCVLSEEYGRPWWEWPQDYRHPGSPAVERFREQHRDRVRFHQWLQDELDRQLAEASAEIDIIHDLAIGADRAGADIWQWQDVVVEEMAVGAPPDEFNVHGQDWGFPPFDPWKLRAARYRPFIDTIRAGFRHAGGLRIDHVMGLFRLFWIPAGASPAEGTYVTYPASDLLDILSLESVRAGAYCVGEDLGTVEPGVREALSERNVLSYRVLWFEGDDPSAYPERALAAVTTHDLPTVAGLWTGTDPHEDATRAIKEKIKDLTGLPDDAPVGEVALALHNALARAPSMVLAATLEDALGVVERPNLPGTTAEEWPNWSLALPQTLEEITQDTRVLALTEALSKERPPAPTPPPPPARP